MDKKSELQETLTNVLQLIINARKKLKIASDKGDFLFQEKSDLLDSIVAGLITFKTIEKPCLRARDIMNNSDDIEYMKIYISERNTNFSCELFCKSKTKERCESCSCLNYWHECRGYCASSCFKNCISCSTYLIENQEFNDMRAELKKITSGRF